jgi:hypothetical protein
MASRSNKMKKLFCLSLLTIAAATPADARWKEVPGLTMRTFVTNCEAMGGTIDEGGNPNVLKCKLPSGTVITCDFGSSPPYCGPDRRTPRKDLNDLFGNSVRPIDPATGGRTPKIESGNGSVGGNQNTGTGKSNTLPGPSSGENSVKDGNAGGGPIVK